jgi:HSP20 family protein
MDNIHNLRLIQLHERLGEIAYHLANLQFSQPHFRQKWRPAVNAYRCDESIMICIDLAGVDKTRIEVCLQGRSLIIRGTRQLPEPGRESGGCVRILAMEIDCGPFEREVPLPLDVDPEGVRAEQDNGLLWVYLPLHPEA